MTQPPGWAPTPGSFVLTSARSTVWTAGVRHRLAAADTAQACELLPGLLRDLPPGAPALVVGALPFDPTAAPALVVPERAGHLPPRFRPAPAPRWGQPVRQPSPGQFRSDVAAVLSALDAGAADKVVLARALDLAAEEPVDVEAVLARLTTRNGSDSTFAVHVPGPAPGSPSPGGAWLVGASPELLVSRRGPDIVLNPLAGTRARDADPELDGKLADELLESGKDRHEHRLVVEHIVRRLAPLCRDLDVPDEPDLAGTADAWHLSTTIRGRVADPAVTSLRLAQELHPTPAVCGTPTDAAARLIGQLESVERGWYAGAVGWCDAAGDGEWMVTLRCALLHENRARLYAGVGVVPGSDPHDELAETSTKFRTALFGLGFDPDR